MLKLLTLSILMCLLLTSFVSAEEAPTETAPENDNNNSTSSEQPNKESHSYDEVK